MPGKDELEYKEANEDFQLQESVTKKLIEIGEPSITKLKKALEHKGAESKVIYPIPLQ